jgi:electron transport complex protein RnfC
MKHAPAVKKYIIGIEKNKPEAIKKMRETFKGLDAVTVKALPQRYPQGAEKVLIYNTVRRVVPEGKLPSDVNVLVLNITSMAVLAKYCRTGMPLVRKSVTLDGSAVASPTNIKAPIGTSVKEIIDFGGGTSGEVGKILLGGPMMGSAVASIDEPITKTTGAITILSKKDVQLPPETACIHCGRCSEACPHLLKPVLFSNALENTDREEKMKILAKNKIMLCVECGSCSFVCPAGRPLVLNNKVAKAEYRLYLDEQKNK